MLARLLPNRRHGAGTMASVDPRHDRETPSTRPTLFLMVGLPASGKTTRARELATESGALLLTPDAWALALFGQDERHQQRPNGKRWLLEGLLVNLAVDALRLGLSVILDFGLWSRDERSALRWLAGSAGAESEIVYLPVDRDVQWRRIQDRWAVTPEQTFPMQESELGPWRDVFEIPDDEELDGASMLPAPSNGHDSWLDWATQHWPSLVGLGPPGTAGRPAVR
jgi:predicted kinase